MWGRVNGRRSIFFRQVRPVERHPRPPAGVGVQRRPVRQAQVDRLGELAAGDEQHEVRNVRREREENRLLAEHVRALDRPDRDLDRHSRAEDVVAGEIGIEHPGERRLEGDQCPVTVAEQVHRHDRAGHVGRGRDPADDLRHLGSVVGLSRRASRIIRQNLVLSLGLVAFVVPATQRDPYATYDRHATFRMSVAGDLFHGFTRRLNGLVHVT